MHESYSGMKIKYTWSVDDEIHVTGDHRNF